MICHKLTLHKAIAVTLVLIDDALVFDAVKFVILYLLIKKMTPKQTTIPQNGRIKNGPFGLKDYMVLLIFSKGPIAY